MAQASSGTSRGIAKVASGVEGLDAVTGGGLPAGRATVVLGSAGSGKTILATQFLVHGIRTLDEPGVLISFDETPTKMIENLESMGWELGRLQDEGLLAIDTISVDPAAFQHSVAFDLEAMSLRIKHAVESIGARRIVIDTIQSIAGALRDPRGYRYELRRLLGWLEEQGLTAIITAESDSDGATPDRVEEFAADCVISLSHRVENQVSTRRLRVVKYRGSLVGTDEYPFLIDSDGFTVMPITSLQLDYEASNERVSTGLDELDELLGGGIFRGATVLISGGPGTGKSSLLGAFAFAAAERGETTTLISYEESPSQIVRNLRSCGVDLRKPVEEGRIAIRSLRPTSLGMEPHLKSMLDTMRSTEADNICIDPITSLLAAGASANAKAMIVRVIDAMKQQGKTVVLSSLVGTEEVGDALTEEGISSLADTWLVLTNNVEDRSRVRLLDIVKSRGTRHDSRVVEFQITDDGLRFG